VRPFWDVHRHRMAPEVGRLIADMTRTRQLRFEAGRVVSIEPSGARLYVRTRRRGAREADAQLVDLVINCTGPTTDVMRAGEPLLDNLLHAGDVRADPLGLGLDVDFDGRALTDRGETSSRIFVVGSLRRGREWEATAAPELRLQAARMALLLSSPATPGVAAVHHPHPSPHH
jgi:uncharacterized NAD(P)/FAD-binding protein YdhS